MTAGSRCKHQWKAVGGWLNPDYTPYKTECRCQVCGVLRVFKEPVQQARKEAIKQQSTTG